MNMFKKNGGFTLVELIVVIAILAILAAVAVPAYNGYITKAQDAAVITELDAIQTAAQAANATAGEITKITVTPVAATTGTNAAPAKTTIKVEAKSIAANFGADFKLFYKGTASDITGAQDEVKDASGNVTTPASNAHITITLDSAIKLEGTSYAKGATWYAAKDTATTPAYEAGWNANK